MDQIRMPENYAHYCEIMRELPWNQQWVMFLSSKTEKDIIHEYPLDELESLDGMLCMKKDGSLTFSLSMNDVFYYASADGEKVEPCDIILLSIARRRFGFNGHIEWAARKRNKRPTSETGITNEQWDEMMNDLDLLISDCRSFFPWWADEE